MTRRLAATSRTTSPEGPTVMNVPDGDAWFTPPGLEAEDLDDLGAAHLGSLQAAQQGKLVVSPAAPPQAIEQYRRLATVLYQAQINKGTRIAMIASAFPSEGKSLTAANLALTLSRSYRRRVLLVDADLRRPAQHDIFELPNLAGVSDWLNGDESARISPVPITRTLTILPGGRPDTDPMGGLSSDRMNQLLRAATERFDWVIVDTPPVALLPDGHLLATLVDAIVLVVAAGRTPAEPVQRAIEQLGRDRIIGVVLNRAEYRQMTAYGTTADYARYYGGNGSAEHG